MKGDDLLDVTSILHADFSVEMIKELVLSATEVIAASVSDDVIIKTLKILCENNKIIFKEIKSQQAFGRILSGYDNPEKLGVDRWLAILGAESLHSKQSLLIIDAGTATTVDLIDNNGQHYGGWIMPGVESLFDSVMTSTSNVKAENHCNPSLLFGKNTDSNVNNACWAMTIGAINEAINQANQKLGRLDKVILTGGNAEHIDKLLSLPALIENKLVFHGLKMYKTS